MTVLIFILLFLAFEIIEAALVARYVDHIQLKNGQCVYWDRLPPGDRYFGRRQDYFDGPISCFGFWFFHVYTQSRD